jgi:trk system potassium uptake protein TrkH
VTTVFMILFGVNFSCYYLLLLKQFRSVFKDEELRLYFGVIFAAIIMIALDIRHLYPTMEETLRHSAFQVGSIITTTGFSTVDFDLWPSFSKTVLLLLMVSGACAGSTGGGIKVARIMLLMKSLGRNIRQTINPRKVEIVRNNGAPVDEKILDNTNAYLAAYVTIICAVFLIISLDGFSAGTNFSAVLCTFNNIGPGIEAVGPTCNFSIYSDLSTFVLTWAMLAGRLEIFPMLVLFSHNTWKKR